MLAVWQESFKQPSYFVVHPKQLMFLGDWHEEHSALTTSHCLFWTCSDNLRPWTIAGIWYLSYKQTLPPWIVTSTSSCRPGQVQDDRLRGREFALGRRQFSDRPVSFLFRGYDPFWFKLDLLVWAGEHSKWDVSIVSPKFVTKQHHLR